MHWFARMIVGLIIMGVGVALMAFAPQLTDMFDQPAEYINYFRIAGMVSIVLGMLFMFGILGSESVTEVSLTS